MLPLITTLVTTRILSLYQDQQKKGYNMKAWFKQFKHNAALHDVKLMQLE